MRRVIHLVLAMMLLVMAVPLAAQDETCTDDDIEVALIALETLLTDARAVQAAGDVAATLAVMEEMAATMALTRAQCSQLAWEGESQKLVGPVEIPAGYYRATVVTEGFFIAGITAMSGECGEGARMRAGSFFNLSSGDASNGAESLLVSEGCTALVETDNISAPWTLMLEKLN